MHIPALSTAATAIVERPTAGPWRQNSFCGEVDGIGIREIYAGVDGKPVSVALVQITNQEANGALISAAPELRAACVAALSLLANPGVIPVDNGERLAIVDLLRAAIAKVERG